MVGLSEDVVQTTEVEFRMPVDAIKPGDRIWLMGGFHRHPILGDSFLSALAVGGAPTPEAFSQVSAMTWGLFNDPQTNLLGGWSFHEDRLRFVQWNTMAEVRQQESLDSWDGRGIGELWGFTYTLIDPLNALSRVGLTRNEESALDSEIETTAGRIIGAVTEQARPAVEQGLMKLRAGEVSSDARFLWLDRRRMVAVAVWFDHLKPMVTSLEVCALPGDDAEYLVCFRRSPLEPQYRVVGPDENDRLMTADAVAAFLPGNFLPNALTLWGNPQATTAEVPPALRRRVFEVAVAGGQNLFAEAELIASTRGRPWELVTRGSVVADWVRTDGMAQAARRSEPLDPFGPWWGAVSDYGNVIANFSCLPDAWDGAINSQRVYAELDVSAVGPCVLTYAPAGLEGHGIAHR